eukprot:scaffold11224_cov65-Phaeocystis_antarctica.AAC.1
MSPQVYSLSESAPNPDRGATPSCPATLATPPHEILSIVDLSSDFSIIYLSISLSITSRSSCSSRTMSSVTASPHTEARLRPSGPTPKGTTLTLLGAWVGRAREQQPAGREGHLRGAKERRERRWLGEEVDDAEDETGHDEGGEEECTR